MIIQFSLQELMLFLLLALGIATGILLFLILLKAKKVVKGFQSLLEINKEAINKTFKTMPGIFENVAKISGDISETTDKLKVSVPGIIQDVGSATSNVKACFGGEDDSKSTPGFMPYFHIVEEVLHFISSVFFPAK